MTKLLHPHALYSPKSIDVFHGGTEREALEESAKLAYDCVRYLPDGGEALYINTMIDQQSLDGQMKKYQSRAPRLLYATWLDKHFMTRLEFITKMFDDGKIKVLVINSFDCAALTQRHRVLLMQWVRSMRNMYSVRIIVFMQNLPGYYGVNGSLRFMAANVIEVGSFKLLQQAELAADTIEEETAIAEEFAEINRLDVTEETEEIQSSLESDSTETTDADTKTEVSEDVSIVPMLETRVVEEETGEEEEASWVSELDDDELAGLLNFFGGEHSSDAAKMVLDEIEIRKSAQYSPLKNKELAYADVV